MGGGRERDAGGNERCREKVQFHCETPRWVQCKCEGRVSRGESPPLASCSSSACKNAGAVRTPFNAGPKAASTRRSRWIGVGLEQPGARIAIEPGGGGHGVTSSRGCG